MSEQPHDSSSFADLAELNNGVVLRPLASDVPIGDLHPQVISGLGSLSGQFVKGIIRGHSFIDDNQAEEQALLARYKAIKGYHGYLSSLLPEGSVVAPTTSRGREVEPVSLADLIQQTVFADPEKPKFHKIPSIIAKRPTDPDVIIILDAKCKENGYDFDADDDGSDPKARAMQQEFGHYVANGYNKYLFGNKAYTDPIAMRKFLQAWIMKLPESVGRVCENLRYNVVDVAVSRLAMRADTKHAITLLNRLLANAIDDLPKNSTESGARIMRVQLYLNEKLQEADALFPQKLARSMPRTRRYVEIADPNS